MVKSSLRSYCFLLNDLEYFIKADCLTSLFLFPEKGRKLCTLPNWSHALRAEEIEQRRSLKSY